MMEDETYLYFSEVRDRKTIARNSRYKKNGCRSKKCTLPSDYKTRKEIAAMNSDAITCKFDEFYTWDEFLKFKDATKIDYIEHICNKYGCSLTAVSILVFGMGASSLTNYITKNGLSVKINKVFGPGAKKGYDKLKLAVEGSDDIMTPQGTGIDRMYLTMDDFNDGTWEMLKNIFQNKHVKITIDVTEDE